MDPSAVTRLAEPVPALGDQPDPQAHLGAAAAKCGRHRERRARTHAMTIPARGHFCWLGTRLPWAYVFAVLSAAENSGLQEITLHHVDPLEVDAGVRALARCPRVRLVRL